MLFKIKLTRNTDTYLHPANSNVTPVFHYDADLILDIGESDTSPIKFADKSSVVGFGIVTAKHKTREELPNGSVRNLMVTVQHTDYDPLTKQQVQFKTQYKIGGQKNLANTFGLFQIGYEVLISGNICGYDQEAFMWIVNALSVSIASGHQTNTLSSNIKSNNNAAMRRRPGLISLEDARSSASKAIQIDDETAKGSQVSPTTDEGPEHSNVKSENYYNTIASTGSKKRSQKDILADAKRAKKELFAPSDAMPIPPMNCSDPVP
ncbi:hypothetical protein PTTG_03644 [Puccinia triticina 1-1 BBBD Race 1]|uniref:Uncharacterized protein n=1 Tax=Puccinia triticina (isolate 1-1 / race 1 (BBBD)) TaxID=630390 RepID=A0A0C4ES70_PUCT1|nr:hypothetical protein PTTG_03644 [Puccinia triticina 1-1 BBBD Race 1]